MKKKLSKIIAIILAVCTLIGTLSISAFAEEPVLTIFGVYDDDIEMNEDDSFKIQIINMETEEKKDVEISMKEATETGMNISLSPGNYAVSDIQYTGTNKDVERRGYGIISYFTIDATPESYSELVIAVGSHSASDLQIQYYDTIQKVNGQYVDYIAEDTSNIPELTPDENKDNNENIGTSEKTDIDDEEKMTDEKITDEKEDIPQKKESNYATKVAPLFVISILFAAIMYKLHKKNII